MLRKNSVCVCIENCLFFHAREHIGGHLPSSMSTLWFKGLIQASFCFKCAGNFTYLIRNRTLIFPDDVQMLYLWTNLQLNSININHLAISISQQSLKGRKNVNPGKYNLAKKNWSVDVSTNFTFAHFDFWQSCKCFKRKFLGNEWMND